MVLRVIIALLVAAIAIAGYFALAPQEDITLESAPKPIEQNSSSAARDNSVSAVQDKGRAVESNSQAGSVELPAITEAQKREAQAHVQSITAPADQPIAIDKADHFVSAEQLLALPEIAETTVAIIDEPTAPTASQESGANPVADASQVQSAAIETAAAPTNAVDQNASAQSATSSAAKVVVQSAAPASTAAVESSDNAKTFAVKIPSFKAQPQSDSQTADSAQSEQPVQVLTTVTATPEAAAAKTTISEAQPALIDEAEKAEILDNLKQNIAEISDVQVEQLATLVNEAAPTKTAAPVQSAPLTNATSATSEQTQAAQPSTGVALAVTPSPAPESSGKIQLRELLNETASDKKRIFYLHSVNPTDEQGIWGIIQQGLTGTFSKGINLSKFEGELKTLIPSDADELLHNRESSFLGRLLTNKVHSTYVYNYEQGNIGTNPDVIKPGQQLIIVTFTEDELISIYQHFSRQLKQRQ
ncbi:MAG: hypothetical protein ACPG4U_11410 [Pseudomonadales bacterium]